MGEGWQGLPRGLLVGWEAAMAAFGAALVKGPLWAGGARAARGGAFPAGAWQELGQGRDKWGRMGCASVPCWTCEEEEEEEQEGKP